MEAVGSPVGAIQSGKSREQPLELSSVGCLHAIVIAFSPWDSANHQRNNV